MLRQISSCTLILCTALIATPAAAADGEILITQVKALQGGVTPGDAPGFPITLSQPGSYKFAGNITPPPGQDGIEIKEADITIDLNGFRLHGQRGLGVGAKSGINGGNWNAVTVRNGTIAAFAQDGVESAGHDWIVADMRIAQNGRYGIKAGNTFRVVSSTIVANSVSGVLCGETCHVESNLVSKHGVSGVELTSGSVLNNTISFNRRSAILGRWATYYPERNVIGYVNNTIIGITHSALASILFAGTVGASSPNFCGHYPCYYW